MITILTHWRTDPDLAGLRDPDAHDRMPPAGSEECRNILSDLDALLNRVANLN
jgi:hypothetical protein